MSGSKKWVSVYFQTAHVLLHPCVYKAMSVCVCGQNNEHKIKGNCIEKSQFFNLFLFHSPEFNMVRRERKPLIMKLLKKTRTQCKQQQTARLNLYVVFHQKTELIRDLHTKTFGYKMLGMCNCLRLLFEDCCVAVSSQRFAFTKCRVDNVRGAAESEESCDKMLHNPVTKGHFSSPHRTPQISTFPQFPVHKILHSDTMSHVHQKNN